MYLHRKSCEKYVIPKQVVAVWRWWSSEIHMVSLAFLWKYNLHICFYIFLCLLEFVRKEFIGMVRVRRSSSEFLKGPFPHIMGKKTDKMESQTHFSKMTNTIFGKDRKALGKISVWRQRRDLFSREVRAEQVNLINVGRFWWFLNFLRNSRQHFHRHCHWRFSLDCQISLLWRHSWLRNNLRTFGLFLRIKNEIQSIFSATQSSYVPPSSATDCRVSLHYLLIICYDKIE